MKEREMELQTKAYCKTLLHSFAITVIKWNKDVPEIKKRVW